MPELAEVDVVCRQLHERVAGERLRRSALLYPKWLKFGDVDDTVGERLVAVRRWGKRLWWEWEESVWVGSLGMTGTVRLDEHDLRHPMLGLEFDEHRVTWYDPRHFGSLYVCESAEEASRILGGRVGVDAAAEMDAAELRDRFRTRVGIKAALLDQRWISGIGNYLADEILWEARVHPGLATDLVDAEGWERLNEARLSVIRSALSAGGLSVRDYHDVDGTRGSMEAGLHAYGRRGLPCHRCEMPLSSGTYGGRTSVWCSRCQPPR